MGREIIPKKIHYEVHPTPKPPKNINVVTKNNSDEELETASIIDDAGSN